MKSSDGPQKPFFLFFEDRLFEFMYVLAGPAEKMDQPSSKVTSYSSREPLRISPCNSEQLTLTRHYMRKNEKVDIFFPRCVNRLTRSGGDVGV